MERFCSFCGVSLRSPPPVICEACGRGHWRNAWPGAAALVGDGDRILLIRRAHDPWRDHWCPPGGFCAVDEHPIAAAERETFEEMGVRVRVGGFVGIWVYPYGPPHEAEDAFVSVAYYHAEPVADETLPFDGQEVAEIRWFRWNELPSRLAPEQLPEIVAAWRSLVAAGKLGILVDRPPASG